MGTIFVTKICLVHIHIVLDVVRRIEDGLTISVYGMVRVGIHLLYDSHLDK
jgi:hypothetical protein